jgi:hypothetical protein
MKIMLDLNVLLDVFQRRVPHVRYSSMVVKEILKHSVHGLLPAHGLTTIRQLFTIFLPNTLSGSAPTKK